MSKPNSSLSSLTLNGVSLFTIKNNIYEDKKAKADFKKARKSGTQNILPNRAERLANL